MTAGIYRIQNSVDGRVYVGQSVNIEARFTAHRSSLRLNKHYAVHMQRAWNRHGEDAFLFEIVETCSADRLDELELEWIIRTKCCDYKHGYNTCPVPGHGPRGVRRRPESIAKSAAKRRGQKRTPEQRARISAAVKGKKRSPETIARIVASHVGKKLGAEHRRNIGLAHKGMKRSAATRAAMREAWRRRKARLKLAEGVS